MEQKLKIFLKVCYQGGGRIPISRSGVKKIGHISGNDRCLEIFPNVTSPEGKAERLANSVFCGVMQGGTKDMKHVKILKMVFYSNGFKK